MYTLDKALKFMHLIYSGEKYFSRCLCIMLMFTTLTFKIMRQGFGLVSFGPSLLKFCGKQQELTVKHMWLILMDSPL